MFEKIGKASLALAKDYPTIYRELAIEPNPYMSSYGSIEENMLKEMSKDENMKELTKNEQKKLLFKMRAFQTGFLVMVVNRNIPKWLKDEDIEEMLIEVGEELAKKFKYRALKNAISSFMPEGEYSASSVIFPLGTFTGGQSSIPIGGSKALSRRMVEKYKSLGGKIETSCEIDHLEIDRNQVKKAWSKDSKGYYADYFIGACDAKEFYTSILKDKYTDKKYSLRFNNPKDYPLGSNIYIGLGYEGTIEDIPRTVKFPVDLVNIGQNKKTINYLQMTHYNYEPDFAPDNHTAITVAINQFLPELYRWEELIKDSKAYTQEKKRIGKEVIEAIENHFPNMKGKLKLLDVATPQTYNRYCKAYKGAFMGFWPTLDGKSLVHTGKIKCLENIMLSGQWLQPPGGLPTALITGKDTVMRICKREKVKFSYD